MTETLKKLITAFFLTCFLLLSFASAAFEVQTQVISNPEFSLVSSAQTTSCACASTIDYVTISNNFAYSQSFSLYSDNPLVSLPSSNVVVAAGSSLAVPYQINTPCDASSQSYDIYVQGAIQTKVISKDLSILQCQNLKVSQVEENLEVGICQEFLSTFRIENVGVFAETYEIYANNFKDYVSVDAQSVSIPAGSYADIAFAYQFSCSMDKTYELSYDVYSQKSDVKAKVAQSVTVTDTYDFGVEVSQPSGTCVGDQNYFEITIENRNEFSDFFTVSVDAPGYVDVMYPRINDKETNTIILDGNSQTKLGVFVTPSHKRDVGVDDITVNVYSKYAQSKQSASTNVSVFECYAFDDVFVSHPGTISTCGEEYITRTLELSHDGYGSPTIELSSSNEMVSFENSSVTFNGQEKKNVTLKVSTLANQTSRSTVTLYASFRNNTVDETSFSLFTDTIQNCYELSPVKKTVSLYEDSEYFTVALQHVGDRSSSYMANLSTAPAYVTLLTQEFDATKGRRNKLLFEIDRVTLIQDASAYNNGSIIGLKGQSELILTHSNPNTSYQNNFTVEFIDYPWYTKSWQFFKTLNPCYMIFFVLAALVILFGIIGVVKTSRHDYFQSNNTLALICLIIFVIAFVFVWITAGIPSSPYAQQDITSESNTLIKMLEDTPKSIDLATFFFDPDNNLVEYGVASISPSLLNYTIDNTTLTLNPREDWYGNTTISIYVVDAYNASAVSPDIQVEIYPVKDYTAFELFAMFCHYINLIVLFILLLVIYITFSFHHKEKEKQLTIAEAKDIKTEKSTTVIITKKSSQSQKKSKKSTAKKTSKKASKRSKKKASKK